MTDYAYIVNDQRVPDARFYALACNPEVPVVIEACAGAGKTWMLVSRIVRALLEGAEPSQILAITFTRKAAGEMRERLQSLLRELAMADEAEQVAQLQMRGLDESRARALAPSLMPLYQRMLSTGECVQVSTIHGWFSRLLRAAPLDTLSQLGLPPQLKLLTEEELDHWPVVWGRWLKRISQEPGDLKTQFEAMVQDVGRHNLEQWLKSALSNRLELQLTDEAGRLWNAIEAACDVMPQWAGFDDPLQSVMHERQEAAWRALAKELGALKGVNAQSAAQGLVDALMSRDPEERLHCLKRALLTDKGLPRKNIKKDLDSLLAAQEWLADLVAALQQNALRQTHQRMVVLSRSLFETYAQFKREGGYIDMVDLERGADHLLRDESLSSWVQQRLDQQLRHVLMDEFQDTSPLQWRALREWLASYGGAGGGGDVKVFVVGDPKQSIYRFRRAEPRVFQAAKDFVRDTLGGVLLACDHTRRNAPGVIQVLNEVMHPLAQAGRFTGFRPHTTASGAPSVWRVLPDVRRPGKDDMPTTDKAALAWRDSLTQPRHEPEEALRAKEAEQCAATIDHLIRTEGRLPGDFFILARKRQSLLLAAQALAARGIANAAPNDTLLTQTPEALDLLAILQVVVSPVHDLALAHALKTPGLDVGDAGLMRVAQVAQGMGLADGGRWWGALTRLALTHQAAPLLADDTSACLARAWQCLSDWRAAAAMLPPHDLMQRIVDESQWRQALARRLPPAMLAQALTHLDALLAQSLLLRGGRDATPYRWVRELKRLKVPLPAAAARGAVQLLTIHGAKGLEADVVFLMDTDGESSRTNTYGVMVDWPPEASAPTACAFLPSEARPPASMVGWLDQEKAARDTEECNALYVALTRAKSSLYISRTEPHRARPEGSWWQAMVDAGWTTDAHHWAPPDDPQGQVPSPVGENTLAVWPSLRPRPAAPTRPEGPSTGWSAGSEGSEAQADLARLGKAVHRLLEMITSEPVSARTPALRELLARQAWRTVVQEEALPQALSDTHLQRIVKQAGWVLDHPVTSAWLDPAQVGWAANELVLWHEGRPVRIDRLVRRDTPGGAQWWVLDYKLGESPEKLRRYEAQLQGYVEAVRALVGHEPVQAALIAGNGEFLPL